MKADIHISTTDTFTYWAGIWLICIVICLAIGVIKGRLSACFIAGLLLGPVGVIVALSLTSQKELVRQQTKECPFCAERILKAAKVCRYCHMGVESCTCPSCHTKLVKPNQHSGSVMTCPNCNTQAILP